MRSIYFDKDIPKALLVKAIKPVWKDVVFSGLSSAYFADLPEPELPGLRWLRVQNSACGICATDLSLLHVDADPAIAPVALPGNQRFYLGHEVVGTVAEVGAGVTRFQVGDRVLMHTRYQGATCLSQEIEPICGQCRLGNYPLCENASAGLGPQGVGGGWGDGYTAHETEVYPVPDWMSDDQAVMVEPLAVAVHTVLKRLPEPGQKVLVLGSGVVGLNVIQALRAFSPDCHISAMARHPHQAAMARTLGADEIIRGEDGYEATARITAAKLYRGMFGNRMLLGGFDIVYDCVGSSQTLHDSLRWARAGGAVVMAGIKLTPAKLDLSPIWYQEVDLVGLNSHGRDDWHGRMMESFDITVELMRQGKLSINGLITHRFPLERWREAIKTAQDKRSGSIKVIFEYSNAT